MSKFLKEKPLFVKCDCSGHMFQIEKYVDEWDNNNVDEGFNLVFWDRGHDGRLCWRERFRWIWNILRTGNPWADEIIIDNTKAKQIVDYINKNLPKNNGLNCCPICNTPEGEGSSCGYCNANHDK